MMVMTPDSNVGTSVRRLENEYEALVQQAMAVPEIARAMEAYAELQRYQAVSTATAWKVTFATGGNTSTNARMIPFGIGGNS